MRNMNVIIIHSVAWNIFLESCWPQRQ